MRTGGAHEAAEAFLGRAVEGDADVQLPGRLEWRSDDEVWDGAHTPEAVEWLLERTAEAVTGSSWCPCSKTRTSTECSSGCASAGSTLVATQSSNPRALPAEELADRARRYVSDVVTIADPVAALRRAHELGPRVLVTGSLYLLADLHAAAR